MADGVGRDSIAKQIEGTMTMNPDWLLKHFEQISEAPEGVPRLRRFILDLAVRGKLVERDPTDEPAVELLKHAQTNRAHGSNGDKRQNQKLYSPIQADEIAAQIPENWILARVGELLDIQYGKALPAADRSDQGSVAVYGSNGIVGYCETALAQEPTIIIGRKGSAGALNLCDGPSWTTDVAYFLIPPAFFNIRFLFVALRALDLTRLGKGVKPGLNRSEAYQLPMVVPSLAEQHRIVAKVDELMALCDELEVAQARRERRRDRLVAATLHGLGRDVSPKRPLGSPSRPLLSVDSKRPHSSSENGGFGETALPSFFLNHLPRLTTRPEHIQQLRQTILNLAIRGQLVPQEPSEGTGSDLLAQIKKLKAQMLLEKPIRGEQDVEYSIPSNEAGFPSGWAWAHVDDVAIVQGGKRLPKAATFSKEPTDHIYIRVTDMKNGTINEEDVQYITPEVHRAIARYTISQDDLYITIAGTIGQVGRVPRFFDGHNLTENAAKIVFRGMDPDYFCMVLSSGFVQQQFRDKTKQMAQPKLALKRILGAKFPLAPLAEQHRIVAKVEELMALCDKLEARISATAATHRQFLEATLQEALSRQHSLHREVRII